MAFHYRNKNEKTWKIKWYDSLTGKPRTESAKTTNESVAIRLAKRKTAELELGIANSQLVKVGTKRHLISEAFEEFIKAHKFTPAYIRSHRRAFQNLVEACGDKYCQQFSQSDYDRLMEYLRSLRRIPITTRVTKSELRYKELFLSENTIANYTRHLSAFFLWLLKKKYITENYILKTKEKIDDPEPIPEGDQKRIFDFLLKYNKKYYDLFRLMYLGAYRATELCNVTSEDFEMSNQIMKVKNFKAKRTDRIPLLQDMKDHLEQMNFTGQITTLNYNGLKSLWDRLMKLVNKEYNLADERKMKYHLHQLRKSRGTDLANMGVDLLWLHKYMRHTSLEVTRKYYIKVDIDKARESMNKTLRKNLGDELSKGAVNIDPENLRLFYEIFSNEGNLTRIVNEAFENYLKQPVIKSVTQNTPSGSLLGHLPQKLRLVE